MPEPSAKVKVIAPTLLKLAVAEGNLGLVRRLLKTKNLPPDVPDPDNGWPMLFYAIAWHQNDIVQYFIETWHEAAELSRDFQGNTALMVAIEHNNEMAFTMLLTGYPLLIGAINKDGKSALIIATEKGHSDMIAALLEKGASVDSTDMDGSTPLHHAAAYGHYKCVDILLDHGANPAMQNKRGWSALDYSYSFDLMRRIEERMVRQG